MENEIWKDIPGYEGLYQCSNMGRVKSLQSLNIKSKHQYQGDKILTPCKGLVYHHVNLCNSAKFKGSKTIMIHILVAICFLGHKQDGHKSIVDHKNNNEKLNNRLDNLQIVTNRKNSSKDRVGTSKYTGVSLTRCNTWVSRIWIDGRDIYLGTFKTELEAHNAYQKRLSEYEGN